MSSAYSSSRTFRDQTQAQYGQSISGQTHSCPPQSTTTPRLYGKLCAEAHFNSERRQLTGVTPIPSSKTSRVGVCAMKVIYQMGLWCWARRSSFCTGHKFTSREHFAGCKSKPKCNGKLKSSNEDPRDHGPCSSQAVEIQLQERNEQ